MNLLRASLSLTWKQKSYKEGWIFRYNILGCSKSCIIRSLPKNTMVFSSYMLSPNYCGYLEKRGQHRVGLIRGTEEEGIVSFCATLQTAWIQYCERREKSY
eukprot:5130900-Ditylum_brightwellii.AAC.2